MELALFYVVMMFVNRITQGLRLPVHPMGIPLLTLCFVQMLSFINKFVGFNLESGLSERTVSSWEPFDFLDMKHIIKLVIPALVMVSLRELVCYCHNLYKAHQTSSRKFEKLRRAALHLIMQDYRLGRMMQEEDLVNMLGIQSPALQETLKGIEESTEFQSQNDEQEAHIVEERPFESDL